MSQHKQSRMVIPKFEANPPPTYIVDPVYRRHGIPYVTIIGKLAPLKVVVVKKPKGKRRKQHRSQHQRPADQSDATVAYVRAVRATFSEQPEVFQEFLKIMAEINRAGANLLELINRVVALFNGHSDLIYSFDAFLPQGYELEMQDDAVVVKIYKDGDPDPLESEYVFPSGQDTSKRPETARLKKDNIDEAMEFIRGVKKTFPLHPEVYREFMDIFQAFHMKNSSELDTIKKVVGLFQGHPNLVLGFNEFLSTGFKIHMYDTKKYTIQYKNEDGDIGTTTISA